MTEAVAQKIPGARITIMPGIGHFPMVENYPAFRRFPLVSRVVLGGGVGAVLTSFLMTISALLGVRWHIGALVGALTLLPDRGYA